MAKYINRTIIVQVKQNHTFGLPPIVSSITALQAHKKIKKNFLACYKKQNSPGFQYRILFTESVSDHVHSLVNNK